MNKIKKQQKKNTHTPPQKKTQNKQTIKIKQNKTKKQTEIQPSFLSHEVGAGFCGLVHVLVINQTSKSVKSD